MIINRRNVDYASKEIPQKQSTPYSWEGGGRVSARPPPLPENQHNFSPLGWPFSLLGVFFSMWGPLGYVLYRHVVRSLRSD